MNYIEYQFDIQPKEPFGEILTALADLEFESFVETDNGISAYVRTDLDDESGVQQIIDDLKDVTIRYTKRKSFNKIGTKNGNPTSTLFWLQISVTSGQNFTNLNLKSLMKLSFNPKWLSVQVIMKPHI